MSIKYDPNAPWPLPVLARFLETRELKGFHLIYKNGYVRQGRPYFQDLKDFGEVTSTWSVRVFMMRVDTINNATVNLRGGRDHYNNVQMSENSEDIVQIQKNGEENKETAKTLISDIKIGTIFSFGVQITETGNIVGFANDTWGASFKSNPPNKGKYKVRIVQSTHVVLSIHITGEDKMVNFTTPDHLNKDYSAQPPGSNMTIELKLLQPDKELIFGLELGKGIEYVSYGKRQDLKKDSTIYVYVRNLPNSLDMTTSFDAAPRKIQHKVKKDHGRMRFHHDKTIARTISVVNNILWGS